MVKKELKICEGKIWMDILDPSKQEMLEISHQYQLNEHVVKDCMEPEHLPKYELADEVNFLILRYFDPLIERPGTIQELTNKIAFFYTDNYVLTIRKHEIPFLNKLQQTYTNGKKCDSTDLLIAHIIWQVLETFDTPAERLSERIDFHENSILIHHAAKEQLGSLYYIKRQAAISFRVLLLTLEPINHVALQMKDDPAIQDVKDQHLKMQTLYSQVLEDINNLMSLSLSHSAQRTNDVMRILTIFSAFFLPLTFIVGIYGMNFQFMPELSARWGYPAVLVVMALVTFGIFIWFRKKKWL